MLEALLWKFYAQRELHGLTVVVHAAGEVDEQTVALLHDEVDIAFALATAPHPVVVDLSRVVFLGAAGLNELVAQHRRAAADAVPLRLVAGCRAVLRPIGLTGLADVWDVYPDLGRALARTHPHVPPARRPPGFSARSGRG